MSSSSTGGIGLGGMLFCIFLVLKLVGIISWSWWWVTSPLWAPLVLFLVIFLFFLVIGGIVKIFS